VVARAELDGLRVVELDESEQQAAVIGAVLLGTKATTWDWTNCLLLQAWSSHTRVP
jgi:hypothetical protein